MVGPSVELNQIEELSAAVGEMYVYSLLLFIFLLGTELIV
jgi:hypothetical protein